jgi:uncharacterized protein YbjT (DUF2867 family)
MKESTVTVFGGTGFLGRRVVRRLREHGFSVRIASRHPDRRRVPGIDGPQLESFQADIHDEGSVAEAVAGAYRVVNAVSLYFERRNDKFHSVHVEAAKRVAAQALSAGVERLVHVSRIGAAAASQSLYIRKRGEGELAVQAVILQIDSHSSRGDVWVGRRLRGAVVRGMTGYVHAPGATTKFRKPPGLCLMSARASFTCSN